MQVPLARSNCNYTATDATGAALPSALLATPRPTLALQSLLRAVRAPEAAFLRKSGTPRANFHAAFRADTPPLGFTSVFLAPRAHAASESDSAASTPVATVALPPLALETCAVQAPPLATNAIARAAHEHDSHASDVAEAALPPVATAHSYIIENSELALEFDPLTGSLAAVTRKSEGVRVRARLDLVYFESTRGGGAYLMLPGAQVRARTAP